jgi:hypothetical protein
LTAASLVTWAISQSLRSIWFIAVPIVGTCRLTKYSSGLDSGPTLGGALKFSILNCRWHLTRQFSSLHVSNEILNLLIKRATVFWRSLGGTKWFGRVISPDQTTR